MRVNVYTEELPSMDGKPMVEIVTADYISSRTGQPMTNYGVRIFLKSAPELHYVEGRDDDRSSITFWCGSKEKNVLSFLDTIRDLVHQDTLRTWHNKVETVQILAEKAEGLN